MATQTARSFQANDARREHVPLLIGLTGPSGGGKTYSALRLATGIQTVTGGDIYFIDTESRRALHYADQFKFKHVPFEAPFGSLDYLSALQFCVKQGAKVVIVDSMSHEHEGPGGMVDLHDQIALRMSGGDSAKLERVKMLAWSEPKQKRRALINGILQLNANFIFCFRAKNTSKPIKGKNGRTEVEAMGFMPIAGEEFVFEQTLNALLLPGAGGVPSWSSNQPGERTMIKLPEQFKSLASLDTPLDEATGARLARWASGAKPKKESSELGELIHDVERLTGISVPKSPAEARGELRTFEAEDAEPATPQTGTDPLKEMLGKIALATTVEEVSDIDRDTEFDRSFLTEDQCDELDLALATKRTELRETVA